MTGRAAVFLTLLLCFLTYQDAARIGSCLAPDFRLDVSEPASDGALTAGPADSINPIKYSLKSVRHNPPLLDALFEWQLKKT